MSIKEWLALGLLIIYILASIFVFAWMWERK